MNLELSDEQTEGLTQALRKLVDDDRYPLSPRIAVPTNIPAMLRPEPARELSPPLKRYEPPKASAARKGR